MSAGLWRGVGLSCWLLYVLCGRVIAETVPAVDSTRSSSSLWPVMIVRPSSNVLPRQEKPRLIDDALYASIASYRTLDYLSTRQALARGAHEVVLPQWVVDNRGTFIAFEGIAAVAEVGGSVWLIRHGHRRVARVANVVSIGLGYNSVVHNYQQPMSAWR